MTATLDSASTETLQAIFTAPALPVGTTAAGPDGERIAQLREALDYVGSRRLVADERHLAASVTAIAQVNVALAKALRWHAALGELLGSLPAGRARNALLGDIRRGGLVTWATAVPSWKWTGERWPSQSEPVGHATGELEVDEFPGLYDVIVTWEASAKALVVVPTHRDRLAWSRAAADQGWTVRFSKVFFHVDELIPLDRYPAEFSSPASAPL